MGTQEPNFDAYSPAQIAQRIEQVGVNKANLGAMKTLMLSILAGAFISFGAAFATVVTHDSKLSYGLTVLLGGVVFCVGLILVVVGGAELFTGNNLIIMAFVDKKVSLAKLLRNWGIVYLGNFVGALSMVAWIYLSNQWSANGFAVGAKAVSIASTKVGLSFSVALTRGVLCNMLVCLAVWLCSSGRSTTDKILAVLFPITAFVALGFEHSVANMYFIPLGMALKSNPDVLAAIAASGKSVSLANLNFSGFMSNLIPVTIGNVFGGGVMVGLVYWFVYGRQTIKATETLVIDADDKQPGHARACNEVIAVAFAGEAPVGATRLAPTAAVSTSRQ